MSQPSSPAAEHADLTLEASVEVAAPPAQVWALVSDLPRLAEWSPQVVRSLKRSPGPVALGTRFLNVNRRGLLVWPTRSKVVHFEPHRHLAFRVKENYTVWSFTLEPAGAGTRVVHRREAPQGISDISHRLTDLALGGQEPFTAELREGMRTTLARIKAEVER